MRGIDYYNNWILGGGNVQYTLLFNRTPNSRGYNITGGMVVDISQIVYPSKVILNGMECKMPEYWPAVSKGLRGKSLSCFVMFYSCVFLVVMYIIGTLS